MTQEEAEKGARERLDDRVKALRKRLLEDTAEVINAECEVYLDTANDDVLWNYKSYLRECLVRQANAWAIDSDIIWGKQMRTKIFEEHRGEILALIASQELEAALEEIETLKKWVKDLQDRRY